MFSLDQLRGFVAVADELHFGRAATRLQMTQPPLSRQIQKLERDIGAQLLDRDNRGVALTPAGRVFLTEARRLLSLADAAPDLARRVAAGSRGTVRIGFTAASAYRVLGRLLGLVAEALPDLDVDLQEGVSREQVAGLLGGELDLGLARPPFDRAAFASRLLDREALLVAVPADHPLATAAGPVDPAVLADEPMVMHSPSQARYFYDLAVRLVPIRHENVVHTVSQVLTMLLLVGAGRGVALVPASATALGIDGVVFLPLAPADAEPVELHLLWSRESVNPALPRVLEALAPLRPPTR
ncbi:LysR substrate-binding domain-containing protein [Modestobacter sp. Leaf380]|uniref:LysR substrate-binding domain-containing protein n=1 Tax=Modestobacter sp. Leaf380 TaxID=1736356 RepID=UPI0006F890E6|nr:LysR substrate-binding domain-containing protein [Modestobacter sp. Leaf380]KQS71139.1 LysR family transcriptional regulator [Modestobacter sp. Leaf380]